MSQEKVNLRKEYKKNRKEILAKEKRQKAFTKFIGYICCLVLVAGIGYSVYLKMTPKPEVDSSAYYNLIQTNRYGLLEPIASK